MRCRVEVAPAKSSWHRQNNEVQPVEAFALAFAVVFVAELGDKTQLVAMSLAARYRTITVLSGITIAYAITNGISVVVGGLLGAALPTTAISVAGAVAFFGFAIWTLRDTDDDEEPDAVGGRSVLVSIVGAMVLAELGDKTMLATATLAAREAPLATWAGATLGITASGALAVAVGTVLGDRLPRRTIRIAAASLFALFGVLLLVDAIV
jgi:putative Ca2+/H+ antiporter (TMEM165/GDT1 family)